MRMALGAVKLSSRVDKYENAFIKKRLMILLMCSMSARARVLIACVFVAWRANLNLVRLSAPKESLQRKKHMIKTTLPDTDQADKVQTRIACVCCI